MNASLQRIVLILALLQLAFPSSVCSQTLRRISDVEFAHQVVEAGGNVWFATDSGAYRVGVLEERATPILTGLLVNAISEARNEIWIGSEKGLFQVEGDSTSPIFRDQIGSPYVTVIKNLYDVTWVGTRIGLIRIGDEGATTTQVRGSVYDIEGIDGSVWVATNRNAYRLNLTGEFSEVFATQSIFVSRVVEAGGFVWLITNADFGLYSHPYQVVDEQAVPVFRDLDVLSIVEVGAEVWILTTSGIHRILGRDGDLVAAADLNKTISGIPQTAVGIDGQVWLGTTRGLYRQAEQEFVRIPGSEDFNVKGVAQVQGAIWAWGDRGVYRLEFLPAAARSGLSRLTLFLVGALLTALVFLLRGRWRLILQRLTSLLPSDLYDALVAAIGVVQRKPDELPGRLGRNFNELEQLEQLSKKVAEANLARNLKATLKIREVRFSNLEFFAESTWGLQPSINILLGKNGYGKSLYFRSLVAVLQNRRAASSYLFPETTTDASILVELRRNQESKTIKRTTSGFSESIGPVPLLAIPDWRFVTRSSRRITAPSQAEIDLSTHGADHFINQLPYGAIIDTLLYEICLDYIDHGKTFKLPIFDFFMKIFERLTDEIFEFYSIRRVGRSAFEINVLTEGASRPIPLQHASQGTLSILATFGIIRSYLRAIFGEHKGLEKRPAFVVIDELDSHLHPSWQQRLVNIMRDVFPNIQFLASAHSPIVVAGCDKGEVAVLRKRADGFRVEQLNRDFIGATARELYEEIFEIEDLDETYLRYSTKSSLRYDYSERINELIRGREMGDLSVEEQKELDYLIRESRLIRRAVEVREEQHMAQVERSESHSEGV